MNATPPPTRAIPYHPVRTTLWWVFVALGFVITTVGTYLTLVVVGR